MANNDPAWSSTETNSEDMANKASQAATSVKDRASQMGRNAAESLDRGIDSAADKLQRTASSISSSAPQSGRMGDVANRAADGIERTATYMREHDVRDMVGDLEGVVRRNPGPSVLIAAAFGFLIGTALRGSGRDRY